MDERPLSALRPGDRATIGRLEGSGPVRRRLLELGLTPGTAVTLVRLAPLRDPMEVRVRGYQLCVRRSEADAVWVHSEPTLFQHGDSGTGSRGTGRSAEVSGNAAAATASSSPPSPPSRSVSPCRRVASLALAPLRALSSR